MAILKIKKLKTKTIGDFSVVLRGIDLSDEDCIYGVIKLEGGWKKAHWNRAGIHRGGTDATNLSKSEPEVSDVMNTVDKLGYDSRFNK